MNEEICRWAIEGIKMRQGILDHRLSQLLNNKAGAGELKDYALEADLDLEIEAVREEQTYLEKRIEDLQETLDAVRELQTNIEEGKKSETK